MMKYVQEKFLCEYFIFIGPIMLTDIRHIDEAPTGGVL